MQLRNAVLSSYDKVEQDASEDLKVVTTRMGVCVNLQKDNPMVYKLRADFCMVRVTPEVAWCLCTSIMWMMCEITCCLCTSILWMCEMTC